MSILQTMLVIFCVILTGVIILLSCQLLSTQDVVVCSGSYDKVCTYYKGVLK